ncbi:MAG TPA: pyridoxal 5'-phosphate synthase glutaminase subunit PdxT [Candidatus Eremiobacteraceae bacterium]|nr:pyridoxal 5'-phosphate synthase glutaminase subunit PdxT [Candidatus Eremiobacteraceae bacterium]
MTIGVLGLQGDVEEHLAMLERIGASALRVKTPLELAQVDGLIIPGGESTTVGVMLNRFGLAKPLLERVKKGMPVWGTCMGMIVMAEHVVGSDQPTLGLLHIDVVRNAFGRQVESAEVPLTISGLGGRPFPGVFIRAPWIEAARGDAKIMASLDGKGVMVRQGNLLGTSFHPELTDDPRIHQLFADLVARSRPALAAR